MAHAFDEGGRLYAMGNGGSSCDAIHLTRGIYASDHRQASATALRVVDDGYRGVDGDWKRPGFRDGVFAAIENAGATRGYGAGRFDEREIGQHQSRAADGAGDGDDDDRVYRARWRPDAGDVRSLLYCAELQHSRIQEAHETLLHIIWDLVHVIRGEEDVI